MSFVFSRKLLATPSFSTFSSHPRVAAAMRIPGPRILSRDSAFLIHYSF